MRNTSLDDRIKTLCTHTDACKVISQLISCQQHLFPQTREAIKALAGPVDRFSTESLAAIPYDVLCEHLGKEYPLPELLEGNKDLRIVPGFDLQTFGACIESPFLFYEVSSEKEYLQKATPIVIDNQVIGLHKHKGSDLFLSFVSKESHVGSYPLIRGGIYSFQKSIRDYIKSHPKKNIRMSSLVVKPLCHFLSSGQFTLDDLQDIQDSTNELHSQRKSLLLPVDPVQTYRARDLYFPKKTLREKMAKLF